jgi:hypothetical protein
VSEGSGSHTRASRRDELRRGEGGCEGGFHPATMRMEPEEREWALFASGTGSRPYRRPAVDPRSIHRPRNPQELPPLCCRACSLFITSPSHPPLPLYSARPSQYCLYCKRLLETLKPEQHCSKETVQSRDSRTSSGSDCPRQEAWAWSACAVPSCKAQALQISADHHWNASLRFRELLSDGAGARRRSESPVGPASARLREVCTRRGTRGGRARKNAETKHACARSK